MKNRVSAMGWKALCRISLPLRAILSRHSGHEIRRPPPEPPADPAPPPRLEISPLPLAPSCPSPPNDPSCHPLGVSIQPHHRVPLPCALAAYLRDHGNRPDDICKANRLLQMPRVLLEIGCGAGEAARLIALKNPDMAVIASDIFDGATASCEGSYYGRIARQWRDGRLPAQQESPANLVILRAEAEVLRYLPLAAIDTILLVNPEPRVGRAFLELLLKDDLYRRIKEGPARIVILPYSRELGVMACGGCDFEHDPDWSRGLGYIMGSGMPFRRDLPVQWGVDLRRVSSYSGNSTQSEIYICGTENEETTLTALAR